MTRNSRGAAVVGALASSLILAGTALAQTPTSISANGSANNPGTGGHAIVVEIDTAGQTLVRGVLQSVGQRSMTVSSWGGTWTILYGPNTQFIPSAPGMGSAFKPGDIVGILGTMTQSGLAVNAGLIHDWTATDGIGPGGMGPGSTGPGMPTGQGMPGGQGLPPGITPSGQGIPGMGPSTGSMGQYFYQGGQGGAFAQNTGTGGNTGASAGKWGTLYTGVASNVRPGSFTLTKGNTTYTVNVSPSTILLTNARSTLQYASIKQNDNIRVDGHLNGSTITATVVRDTSR